MKNIPFINGFEQSEEERIKRHLEKLLPHLKPGSFIIVGGLAIRYHYAVHGLPIEERPFNDLDIIIDHEDSVLPTIVQDFLVGHHHPTNSDGNFYFAMVDPETKTKVDVFDSTVPPESIIEVVYEGQTMRIPSLEDQLVKTVFDMLYVLEDRRVDPKQFRDGAKLWNIANQTQANEIWSRKFGNRYPDIPTAMAAAQAKVDGNPDLLKEKPFRTPTPVECKECVDTPEFPLTSREKIYEVMGYGK